MKNNKLVILLIISLSLLISIIVYADTILLNANEVSYDNSGSTLTKTNLQEALDELYNKCKTPPSSCPSHMNCTSKPTAKCRRVLDESLLHTETCQESSNYCAAVEGNGNTITYGQVGSNGTLTPGDAFDCDTNGNGTYDQRFYYVSDYYDTSTKSYNGDVAALVYYSNVTNGEESTDNVAYDSNGTNYNGPVTAAAQLPTTTQWSNISLYKTQRQILAENNKISTSGGNLPLFDYSNYAARLLTYQEVYNGCYNSSTAITNTGGLNNCNFLMENTKYSNSSSATNVLWLETPYASSSDSVYNVVGSDRRLYSYGANNTNRGARPVIELEKKYIDDSPTAITISFNANGGTGSMSNQFVGKGYTEKIKENEFTRSGYEFVGWNTAADGSGTAYLDKEAVTLNSNLTLYAQWSGAPFDQVVKLGDYVFMIPNPGTLDSQDRYATDTSKTGYSSVQYIYPKELRLWRVLNINNDGTVELISENVSSTPVSFTGATGYANFVGYLNELADQYQNPTYTKSARHIGYNGQTEYITNKSKFNGSSNSAPWSSSTTTTLNQLPSNESLGGGDTMYQRDLDLLTAAGIPGRAYRCSTNDTICSSIYNANTGYYIASRYYYYDRSYCFLFEGRQMFWTGESLYSGSITRYYNRWYDETSTESIRPIITLKSTVAPSSGTGASDDPYVFN